jgi:hypothetical protein
MQTASASLLVKGGSIDPIQILFTPPPVFLNPVYVTDK